MRKIFSLALGLILLLFGLQARADAWVGSGYLIKTEALLNLIQKYGSVAKIQRISFESEADAIFYLPGAYQRHSYFYSRNCSFYFDAGSAISPPGPNGHHFKATFKGSQGEVSIEGDLVHADAMLRFESPTPSPETTIPEASVMINAGWREKPYALLIYSVNAKH